MMGGGNVVSATVDQNAATKVQKIFRSHRARRQLADSAVAEAFWWKALDSAQLSKNTISFFVNNKPENASSKWIRVATNASQIGQGLCEDDRALTMAFQHWIEAIDPRHRYGGNLEVYYKEWCKSQANQPFFYWLDIGEGRDMDMEECPRSKLNTQCIKYLNLQEREQYEYVIEDGKIIHKLSRELIGSNNQYDEEIYIYVMSSTKKIYAGLKKKGQFQHSSFLSGGAIIAAGTLAVKNGILKRISPLSGHYRPKHDNVKTFLDFIGEKGIDLNEVEVNMDPVLELQRMRLLEQMKNSFNAST